MIPLKNSQKTIGTLVPISALVSITNNGNDNGTFAVGLSFLDWLKKTNQSAWQLLPLYQTQLELNSATKRVPSPYKGYGIGLDPKYLPESFVGVYPSKSEKNDFIETNNQWIHDYAFFCALSDHFKTDDWRKWNDGLRNRDKATLDYWSNQLAKKIDNQIILQWQLHQAYMQLRNKAKKLHISLQGDLPFYVCIQSPLVWAHQSAFDLEKDGSMQYISGVPNIPPSFFGRQIWGHPLYNWQSKENWDEIISLWKIRLRYLAGLFNLIRFDYAKAFYHYGAMDVTSQQNDGYRDGPGTVVFEELVKFSKECGLFVFVEDSGNKIDEMRESMKRLNSPGIKILRFGLDEKKDIVIGEYADVLHYPKFTVAYTTTHDTETLLGYLYNLTPEQKQRLAIAANVAYNIDDKIFTKILRNAVITSPAQTVIIPIQDWLVTIERINTPGTELSINDPNWNFHLQIPIEHLPTQF
ncbi:MAG TPA: 4-alpha-glucanotransferase [Candidatus Sulfotelmatobacter sp.]|jgi:4-alpha-glucanotransferase|nr:4-alpha-glucanotransferase [Candidatus Sulfotelmatobacter sp.]